MPSQTPAEVAAAGRTIAISNPQKLFFAERGETKLDLVNYYLALEQPVLRAMGGRPVLMERYPDGAGGPSFFQKRVPKNAPDWLTTTTVRRPTAPRPRRWWWTTSRTCCGPSTSAAWASTRGRTWPPIPTTPTSCGSTLTRRPGVGFEMVREAAAETRALLDELGIAGYPKTTGRHGIHIYVRPRPSRTRSACGRRRWRSPASWSGGGPT